MLTVIDVCETGAAGCVHVFPAVYALARSFVGFAKFGRCARQAAASACHLMPTRGAMQARQEARLGESSAAWLPDCLPGWLTGWHHHPGAAG
jgi:hypothetical protein